VSVAQVSPSPYASLGVLATTMRLIAAAELEREATSVGFTLTTRRSIESQAGKTFVLQIFQRTGSTGAG
jgi:hypothetical protein